MKSKWRPDDSFVNKQAGVIKGVKRINDALKKRRVRAGQGIRTSRDTGIAAVRGDLKRTTMPTGFQQWQLPVALGPDQDVLAFVTAVEPDAELPEHSHKVDLFRVIIHGSVFHKGKELTAGHWMSVKKGEKYGLKAGPTGCYMLHMYW